MRKTLYTVLLLTLYAGVARSAPQHGGQDGPPLFHSFEEEVPDPAESAGEEGGETLPEMSFREGFDHAPGSGGVGPGYYRGNNGTRATLGNFQPIPSFNVIRFTVAMDGLSRTVEGEPNFENPNTVENLPAFGVGSTQVKFENGTMYTKPAGSDTWSRMKPIKGEGGGPGGETHPD